MSLRFNYTTNLADFARYEQASINYLTAGDVRQNRHFSEQIYALIFVLLFLIVVAILADVLNVAFSVFSFAMGILFYIFMTRYKVRRLRNRLTPNAECSLFGEHEMILDEDGISDSTLNSRFSLKWDAVTDFQEDEQCFYLFLDSLRGLYIPKREVASEERQRELREFVHARLDQRAAG